MMRSTLTLSVSGKTKSEVETKVYEVICKYLDEDDVEAAKSRVSVELDVNQEVEEDVAAGMVVSRKSFFSGQAVVRINK